MKKQLLKQWKFSGYGSTYEVTVPHDYMLAAKRTADSPTGADGGFFQPVPRVV